MKIVNKFQLKIVIFTAMKNRCIMHGRVIVMSYFSCHLQLSSWACYFIRITCSYDLYPLTPQFHIVKVGFTGVFVIFLFLLSNTECEYLLGGSNVYPQSMF